MRLRKQFSFESAHFLPNVPANHKCRRVHGHSFRMVIHIDGPLEPTFGWVMDFAEISTVLKPVIQTLDHQLLNEIPGLANPTSENIAIWVWNQVAHELSHLAGVEIEETCTSGCVYCGDHRSAGDVPKAQATERPVAQKNVAPLEDVAGNSTVPAAMKELEDWRPDPDDLKEIVAMTARTLDTVSRLTQYEDEKANRILTAIAFISTFVAALFTTIPNRFPPNSMRVLWESGVHYRTILLGSTYFLLFLYSLFVAAGLTVVLWAVMPRFKTSIGWINDVGGTKKPGWKKTLTSRPRSLLFFEGVADTHPTMWAREFAVSNAYELGLSYAKNSIVESHLVSEKIRYKLKWLKRGVWLFYSAALIVIVLVLTIVLNLIVTPPPPVPTSPVIVDIQQLSTPAVAPIAPNADLPNTVKRPPKP